jgi:hypothetical protein
MRILRLVVSILLLVGQSIAGAWLVGAEQIVQKPDPIFVFSNLKTTLSKLYPIEHWSVSTTGDAMNPFAPRLCWKFFRPDPEVLSRLGEGLRAYQGNVSWVLGPPARNAPICLVAAKRRNNQFIGYPPTNRSDVLPSNVGIGYEPLPTQEFIDQALGDVSQLCSYLERYLKLEDIPAKSFDSHLVAPYAPPSLEDAPVDFVERGMHVAWILPPGTNAMPGEKRMLHFSVTQDEWRRIYADILDNTSATSAASQDVGLFPLLSRISESESTYFRLAEIGALREECLRARTRTTDPLAIRGIDKLIFICDWARHMTGDVLLRAP